MAEEKLLTVREVSLILGISEKEVIDMVEEGLIPAYKVGGVYLRFKREQVEQARKIMKPALMKEREADKYSFRDRVSDFFYFNDFYIFSAVIILVILVVIFRGF